MDIALRRPQRYLQSSGFSENGSLNDTGVGGKSGRIIQTLNFIQYSGFPYLN